MTKAEVQKSLFLNQDVIIGRQIVWLTGMLSVLRNALTNYRHNQNAAFKNGVECLSLMGSGVYLSDDQRGTLMPMITLARDKPEALRGLSSVIRQFLRQLNRQVMSNAKVQSEKYSAT